MGQNGAGKSTLFKLITGEIKPTSGEISIDKKLIVATARQVMPASDMTLSIEEYFRASFADIEKHELHRKIASALEIVNLKAPLDKIISSFSGGQQARLLLASALIQDPDLLLLDEPTNNLDYTGIAHLTDFLVNYPKSVIVISHDTEFLNAFTEGVLYLDSFKKKIEQYAGDYDDVLSQIASRIEKERQLNARMKQGIQENKDKSNFFAHKGGGLRAVAKKMREKAAKMESEMVEVRRDDKTIRPFVIPEQTDLISPTLRISSFTIMKDHEVVEKKTDVVLGKNMHLLISGPNGIGKSTFIDSLVSNGYNRVEPVSNRQPSKVDEVLEL